ncbi:uncharacterized protein J3D65DRAFT_313782 [Phyllosticta citribraziliensis]|uniref:Uncharacterized protein n=1 Tax=Phyllosticta citribraziliensis TaxID=989973 RepID=A0ABR1LSA9_9PEZI
MESTAAMFRFFASPVPWGRRPQCSDSLLRPPSPPRPSATPTLRPPKQTLSSAHNRLNSSSPTRKSWKKPSLYYAPTSPPKKCTTKTFSRRRRPRRKPNLPKRDSNAPAQQTELIERPSSPRLQLTYAQNLTSTPSPVRRLLLPLSGVSKVEQTGIRRPCVLPGRATSTANAEPTKAARGTHQSNLASNPSRESNNSIRRRSTLGENMLGLRSTRLMSCRRRRDDHVHPQQTRLKYSTRKPTAALSLRTIHFRVPDASGRHFSTGLWVVSKWGRSWGWCHGFTASPAECHAPMYSINQHCTHRSKYLLNLAPCICVSMFSRPVSKFSRRSCPGSIAEVNL